MGARGAWLAAAIALASCGGEAHVSTSTPARARTHPAPPTPASPRPQPTLRTATVRLEPEGAEPVEVEVELARSEHERARGLMFRRSMPPDHGMLFVFDHPERQSFWMRNTFLRLDIVFLDADRRIVGIVENASPLTTTSRAVEADSQYVLEVHGGFCSTHALAIGTPAQFIGIDEPEEPHATP
ncbi:MAG: DUF192 domain-containing protein [Sandaracinaceae bacterium]